MRPPETPLRGPLTLVLAGIALVVLDARVQSVELLPDAAGFALAATGVAVGRPRGLGGRWALLALAAFAVAALLSLPQALAEPEGALASAPWLALDVALAALLLAVAAAVRPWGARNLSEDARWGGVAMAVLLPLGWALDLHGGAVDPLSLAANGLALLVAWLVVFAWALAVLWRARRAGMAPDAGPTDKGPRWDATATGRT